MPQRRSRLAREADTITKMITMYCQDNHRSDNLCQDCAGLEEYSRKRLEKCPFQEGKTTCAKCPAHCYKPDMREKVRAVMRYSGPRMMLRHPASALRHVIDGRRQEPLEPPPSRQTAD